MKRNLHMEKGEADGVEEGEAGAEEACSSCSGAAFYAHPDTRESSG